MKDPAFLFYPRDFLHGTRHMTDSQVGFYIRLICEQADSPEMAIPGDIFSMLCSTREESTRSAVVHKFELCSSGYSNQRLNTEITKRIRFTESRRKNLTSNKSEPHMGNDMVPQMANANANTNSNSLKTTPKAKTKPKTKAFIPPTYEEMYSYCLEKGYAAAAKVAFDYYKAGNWTDRDEKPVKNWKQKLIAVWFKPQYKSNPDEIVPPGTSEVLDLLRKPGN